MGLPQKYILQVNLMKSNCEIMQNILLLYRISVEVETFKFTIDMIKLN